MSPGAERRLADTMVQKMVEKLETIHLESAARVGILVIDRLVVQVDAWLKEIDENRQRAILAYKKTEAEIFLPGQQ